MDSIAAASHPSLRDAVAVARLAPSSHNSQPWAIASFESREAVHALCDRLGVELSRADERWLVLALDTQRTLKALPSLATEMRLSCGMFLQLFAAALAHRGLDVRILPFEPELAWRPLAGWPASWTPLVALAIAPGARRMPRWSPALAPLRRTNRAPYLERSVGREAQDDLRNSEALFARDRDRDAVSVKLIDTPELLRAIGRFVGKHASVDFSHAAAWSETFGFIRFSGHAAAASADGFPLTQLFGPLPAVVQQLLRVSLAPSSMRVLRRLGVPAVMARGLGRLVGATPLAACVSVAGASVSTEVTAGGVAMDLWMRATASGLALHPVSAILQHADIRDRFERMVGCTGRAVFFARVGHPTTTFPPTPRRSLDPGGQGTGWVRL